MKWIGRAAVAATMVAALGACGGGNENAGDTATAAGDVGTTPAPAPAAAPMPMDSTHSGMTGTMPMDSTHRMDTTKTP